MRKQFADRFMASDRQCAAMKARHQCSASHVLLIPPERRAVLFDQFLRSLVMSVVAAGFSYVMKQGRSVKAGPQIAHIAGTLPRSPIKFAKACQLIVELQRQACHPLRVR